jgi:hypothetical protein
MTGRCTSINSETWRKADHEGLMERHRELLLGLVCTTEEWICRVKLRRCYGWRGEPLTRINAKLVSFVSLLYSAMCLRSFPCKEKSNKVSVM